MWRRYRRLTRFFLLSIHASAAKIQPDKVVRCCQNGDFLRPVFSASSVQHISDMHSKFALRPHHVWKYRQEVFYDLLRALALTLPTGKSSGLWGMGWGWRLVGCREIVFVKGQDKCIQVMMRVGREKRPWTRSMVDIQSPTAEIRRRKKEERKKKIETTGQKYRPNGLPYYIGRP